MNKRSLYARLLTASCCLFAAGGVEVAAARAQASCARCVAITIDPGQVLLLPDELNGLVVLVRALPNRTPDLLAAVAHVARAGGKPAILVPAPGPLGVHALKLRLAELRGMAPEGVTLALEDRPSPEANGDVPLVSYADVILTGSSEPVRGARYWRRVGRASVAEALDATRTGGFEHWVLDAPPDVIDARNVIHAVLEAAAAPAAALLDEVEVTAAAPLTAAEIVARHQAAARRQTSVLRTSISEATMRLTFEAPGFPAPVTVSTETVIYQADGRTELEQRRILVNGLAFSGGQVPRLPIIEPERVAALPLTITLSSAYRYSRHADATVNGVRCYVIGFEPVSSGPSYRGRAWIAMDGFHLVRTAAEQTGLRGAIVASEQVDDYREVAPGVWMLAHSDVRQLYEGAGHRTPIHRVLSVSGVQINPADFEARLLGAYRSPSVILRDTPDGYRYVRREPLADGSAAGTQISRGAPVEQRADRVRTFAAGVIVDPNISRPLPFAGLNYVDFDLFGTGTQLNAFFGGSYGQLALAVPSLAGSRWQLGARGFAIASSYNDRSFRDGQEIYEENLLQRPAHASVWLMRPLGRQLSLRAAYELDYTRLRAAPYTAPDFIVPSDQMVHGLRMTLEGQRAGWTGSVWWNVARRSGWRPWGRNPDPFDASERDFQRFGGSISRATSLTPQLVTRIEASIMGGRDLDRFSRYAFGTFDNRLRGYPAAFVRYDRGGVIRGAAAWSVSRFLRLDGFVDTAVVRDRGFGDRYRNYTGVGAAVEAPLPLGLLGALEWGYGFRGRDADGGRGTQVLRVTVFRVF